MIIKTAKLKLTPITDKKWGEFHTLKEFNCGLRPFYGVKFSKFALYKKEFEVFVDDIGVSVLHNKSEAYYTFTTETLADSLIFITHFDLFKVEMLEMAVQKTKNK